jgi:hypothetical protein
VPTKQKIVGIGVSSRSVPTNNIEGIGVSSRSVPTKNRGDWCLIGWCLQTFVIVGWFLQIYKNMFLWFSPKRVSMLNIVSSSCYIYVIASLWFMNVKNKNDILILIHPPSLYKCVLNNWY